MSIVATWNRSVGGGGLLGRSADPVRMTFKWADEIRAICEAHGVRPSEEIAYCQVAIDRRSISSLFI